MISRSNGALPQSFVWDFIQANQFFVGALTGSLAAYLLGLIVSHLRREKRWLGYSLSSRNVAQANFSKLTIHFDGRPIERLDSHQVDIRNIGNRPLTDQPVIIESKSGGQIFERETTAPEGASFSIVLERADKLVVTVDLLNPGEAFTVGLTVANSQSLDLSVVARGELLQVKEIGPRISTDDLIDVLKLSMPLPFRILSGVNRPLQGNTKR